MSILIEKPVLMKKIYCLIFVICEQIIVMQRIYEVIVVGAGISGIGASVQLSKANVEHIIIEARDRIGGRIVSKLFDGVLIQLGASYVHSPQKNNKVAEIIAQKGIQSKPTNVYTEQCQQYFYEGKGEISKEVRKQAFQLLQQLCFQIEKKSKSLVQDLSIREASLQFLSKIQNQSEEIQNSLKCNLNIFANNQGAEIHEISAKQYDNDVSESDIIPLKGYSAVLDEIFKDSKASVKFNQEVIKIDYSQEIIKIYTKKNVYLSKKVISSLPLGVLQNNYVSFEPNLPQNHKLNLSKIGLSLMTKMFVSFEEPFWDPSAHFIYFVSKNHPTKFPVAASIIQNSKYVLCFYVSVQASKSMGQLSNQEILNDVLQFLGKFNVGKQIKARKLEITRWEADPFSLGSYSYYKVGENPDIDLLRRPIENKIWFVGEYCHLEMSGCAHAAFETGVWAAQQIISQNK